jgi:hypothetical protein
VYDLNDSLAIVGDGMMPSPLDQFGLSELDGRYTESFPESSHLLSLSNDPDIFEAEQASSEVSTRIIMDVYITYIYNKNISFQKYLTLTSIHCIAQELDF